MRNRGNREGSANENLKLEISNFSPPRRLVKVHRSYVTVAGLLLSLLALGCSKRVSIDDPTKPAILNLTTSGNVHWIDVAIRGHIDGSAAVMGYSFTQAVSGDFDVMLRRGEWYRPAYELRYFPTNVKSGRVTVCYRFRKAGL